MDSGGTAVVSGGRSPVFRAELEEFANGPDLDKLPGNLLSDAAAQTHGDLQPKSAVSAAIDFGVEKKPQGQSDLRFLKPGDNAQQVLKPAGDDTPNVAPTERSKLVLAGIWNRLNLIGENCRTTGVCLDANATLRRMV